MHRSTDPLDRIAQYAQLGRNDIGYPAPVDGSKPHQRRVRVVVALQYMMTAITAIGMIAAMPSAASPAVQDWASVDAQAQNIAGALGRTAAPIDRRIKLARCPEQVAITAMDRNSLAVRCASLGWRLRVAMRSDQTHVPQDDVQANFFGTNDSASKRTPAAPAMIRRGDVVRISIDTPNYSVSYPATATQDGRLGEAISLRGADPKNPILAVVTGPGRATISR